MARYGIRADAINRVITCPFKHHSNGNERTASFNYYPESNSFWCFGCKTGRYSTDFVANYEGISRAKSAYKIVHTFIDEVSEDWEYVACNTKEKQDEIIAFANKVREAIQEHPEDIERIESITYAFDTINEKYKGVLDLEGLKALSSKLQAKLST